MNKTITIINPKCRKCSKKFNCNNKTLMLAIDDTIECKDYALNAQKPLTQPLKITPEMKQKQIIKDLLNQQLNISTGIDWERTNSYMGRNRW